MNNTIKEQQQPCQYRTYEKEKGFSDVEDCSKPATRHIENETAYHNFRYVKNII